MTNKSGFLYESESEIPTGSRMAIILSILQIMENKEIAKISVTEVSKNANINRKTFYNYFRDVNDALQYMIENIGEIYSDAFVRSLLETGNLDDFFDFKKRSIEYNFLFYERLSRTRPKNSAYEETFQKIISGIYRKMNERNVNLTKDQFWIIKMEMYSVMMVFDDWIIGEKKSMSMDDLMEFFKKTSQTLEGYF